MYYFFQFWRVEQILANRKTIYTPIKAKANESLSFSDFGENLFLRFSTQLVKIRQNMYFAKIKVTKINEPLEKVHRIHVRMG